MNLSFQIIDATLPRFLSIELDSLVIAGWAGRDLAATEHHISELAAIGVPRPSAIPLYYRVAVNQLTQSSRVQVLGPDTSGEAEVFVFRAAGEIFVSLVSDHTDRRLEVQGVAMSKQACVKPVASTAWCYDDIAAHWDDLVLRSTIEENGKTTLYQEGTLASLRPARELIANYSRSIDGSNGRLAEGTAMSCGTMSAIGGIRPARSFAMELFDPHRQCSLHHRYAIEVLPVVA